MTNRTKLSIATIAAIVVVAGIGVWWFLGGDEPDEVSLESAVAAIEDEDEADGGAEEGEDPTTTEAPAAGTGGEGIEGTWTADAESGDFSYEEATGSFVGFRIAEELASIGATEAVGRTGDVTGTATIEGTTLTTATFEADLTTLTTNDSRRDDAVQDALDTGEHPTATFTLTEPVDLGDEAAAGASVAVDATGELTVHGVTQAVQVPLEAQLVDGTVVIVGSLPITFSDHDVEVPSSQIVVSVEDSGTVELQLLLVQA